MSEESTTKDKRFDEECVDDEYKLFLKLLSSYLHSPEPQSSEVVNLRKLTLINDLMDAYNNQYKTHLKPWELLSQLRERNELQEYEPYEWQKLCLDVFAHPKTESESEDTPTMDNELKDTLEDRLVGPEVCSSDSDTSEDEDGEVYKNMSTLKLTQALEISKLRVINAQRDLAKARQTISLNKEELFKENMNNELKQILEDKLAAPEVCSSDSDTSEDEDEDGEVYKNMSTLKLTQALEISKLRVLNAQRDLAKARQTISLNIEELLEEKIQVD